MGIDECKQNGVEAGLSPENRADSHISASGGQASNQTAVPEGSLAQDADQTQYSGFTSPGSNPPSRDHNYLYLPCQLTHTDYWTCINHSSPEVHSHALSDSGSGVNIGPSLPNATMMVQQPGQDPPLYLPDQAMALFENKEQRQKSKNWFQKRGNKSTTTKDIHDLESENERLSKKLTTKTNEAQGLSDKLQLSEEIRTQSLAEKTEAERKARKLEAEKTQYMNANIQLNKDNTELTKQLSAEKVMTNFLRSKCSESQDEAAKLKKRNRELVAEAATDGTVIENLRKEIRSQEAIVTKVQEAALAKLTENVSGELSNDIIQDRFGDLFEEVREWATANSTKTWTPEEKEGIKSEMIKNGLIVPDEELAYRDRFDMNTNTAADAILETLLNKELCEQFLKRPYFITRPVH